MLPDVSVGSKADLAPAANEVGSYPNNGHDDDDDDDELRKSNVMKHVRFADPLLWNVSRAGRPLFPRKQTQIEKRRTSEKCQRATLT
jgi:hypothetical protein